MPLFQCKKLVAASILFCFYWVLFGWLFTKFGDCCKHSKFYEMLFVLIRALPLSYPSIVEGARFELATASFNGKH